MKDILGQALNDYHNGSLENELWINNKYGDKEEMPVDIYFRDDENMPDMEWFALDECRGNVLDIGAGAGSHALILQKKGLAVAAMDISPLAVKVMRNRSVRNVEEADIFTYESAKFDTLLLLMNGIGLAGTLTKLQELLLHLKSLLNAGGQILFDTSDISYLYEGHQKPVENYYGEIWYQYEYKKQTNDWFQWLYVDEVTMQSVASASGYNMEVLLEDELGQYLARLTAL
jgi:SAM-dependent methyltransferase